MSDTSSETFQGIKTLSRDYLETFSWGSAPPLRSAWALFGKPERAKRSSSPFPPVQPLKPLKFLKPPNFLAQAPKQRKFSGGAQVPSAPQDAPRRPRHPQDSPQDGFKRPPRPPRYSLDVPRRPYDAPRRSQATPRRSKKPFPSQLRSCEWAPMRTYHPELRFCPPKTT